MLDGNAYRFLLDTGMPGQIMLWPTASRRSGLWNDAAPMPPAAAAASAAAAGSGGWSAPPAVRIGDFAFECPLVFVDNPSAYERASFVDGIIGLNFLELLNLSTDIRRGRLWAQPSGRPQRPRALPR